MQVKVKNPFKVPVLIVSRDLDCHRLQNGVVCLEQGLLTMLGLLKFVIELFFFEGENSVVFEFFGKGLIDLYNDILWNIIYLKT